MTFTTEPAAWIGAIRAVILCAILFGLAMTDTQLAGIVVAMEFIGQLIVRQSTTTNKAISDAGMKTAVNSAIAKNELEK